MATLKYKMQRSRMQCSAENCKSFRYPHTHTSFCYEHYILQRSNLPIDPNKKHLRLLANTGECYDDPQNERRNPWL